MATYPLPTLAPTIDSSGIKALSYSDIYQSLVASFQQIFGASAYLGPDSQDGQWIGVLAQGYYDIGQQMVAAFNSMSPSYAQGAGLSALVKLNGITRNIATNSTATGTAIGAAGTTIYGGVVKDANGNLWDLPSVVVIPVGGAINVTVTARQVGAITALSGTINSISNPQYGWQSFASIADAVPGAPVESDLDLRSKQAISAALPSLSNFEAIYSAIGNVPGVTRFAIYENATDTVDADGIPAHSICVVTYGGDSAAVGAALAKKKPPGVQTYGSLSVTSYDLYGLPTKVNFYLLQTVPIYYAVTIKALPGYVSTTGDTLVAALVAFTNSLSIGEDVYVAQAQAIASLMNQGIGQTFYIQGFQLGTAPSPTGTTNLAVAFNQAAICNTSNITLTVV